MAPSDELRSVEPFDLSIAHPQARQVGLIDLFYCVTLFCIILGCHSFISQSAAVVLGAIYTEIRERDSSSLGF